VCYSVNKLVQTVLLLNFKLISDAFCIFQTKPNAPALLVTPQSANISFESVSFGYNPNNLILQNLSFTVPTGKKVAIVGGSGSGSVNLVVYLFPCVWTLN